MRKNKAHTNQEGARLRVGEEVGSLDDIAWTTIIVYFWVHPGIVGEGEQILDSTIYFGRLHPDLFDPVFPEIIA